MIPIIAGLIGGVLIALDAQRNLRSGSATTMFRAYSRHDNPNAFWLVVGIKLLMCVALAMLSSALIVRDSA